MFGKYRITSFKYYYIEVINILILTAAYTPKDMSFTSTPLPKISKYALSPLSKIQTPASEGLDFNHLTEKVSEPETSYETKNEKEPPKGNILHVTNICTKVQSDQNLVTL